MCPGFGPGFFMLLRLDRILTSQGLCSRKEATIAIKKGRVLFNGEVLKTPNSKIGAEGLVITFEGEEYRYAEHIYLMLNKPPGYECSDAPKVHPPVKELLSDIQRNRAVMSAGRLDVGTTGLLLFSDDGTFIHRIAAPKKHLPKRYHARLAAPLDEAAASKLLKGVRLEDDIRPALALELEGVGSNEVCITIDEGRYHQVKRMFVAVGNEVVGLHRQRVGALDLPTDLPEGQWRYLDDPEAIFA